MANPTHNLQQHADAALQWLGRSIDVNGGQGSSHSYAPGRGWAAAYPETTGYLIDTLYDYAARQADTSLRDRARGCAAWLCTVQLESGAFPGLLVGSTRPSIFNTAQILFGLARTMEEEKTADPTLAVACRAALERGLDWLLASIDPAGGWHIAAYVPGYEPSYYSRAVWGALRAVESLQRLEDRSALQGLLEHYAARFTVKNSVADWGFRPGRPAFTHTIAYTLEGFLESALLLEIPAILEKTILAARTLLEVRQGAGDRTAGRYDTDWRGAYWFLCPTGNAQLSVFYRRLADVTSAPEFQAAAQSFLYEILPHHRLRGGPDTFGALPGSAPCWGPYLRFRYPNWAAKFLLDALKKQI